MKKILLIIISILGLGGVSYALTKDLPVYDRLYSAQKREQREINRFQKLFPETLGTYTLYSEGPRKIEIDTECDTTDESLKEVGISGEVCGTNIRAQYREDVTNNVVFVNAMRFSKGAELFRSMLEKMGSKPERISNISVFRVERHELGWFTSNTFDLIITQEGIVQPRIDGESMKYGDATGKNPVFEYLIKQYPPLP